MIYIGSQPVRVAQKPSKPKRRKTIDWYTAARDSRLIIKTILITISSTPIFLFIASIFNVKRAEGLTAIAAYCLMPNHFHILVHEKVEGGISKFMQKLMTSYTMYINKKYDRTGALFGSSFKAVHVTDDNHLKYLFAYINLNPK